MKGLLMGGQACILYGAAEFTRDVDFAVAVSPANLERLRAALDDLRAVPLYFPPLSPSALRKGHACHFRCLAPGLHRVRVDVMSVMRGVDPFAALWRRRRTLQLPGVGRVDVLSLPDLVRAKKTQRDKDWPMIRRLIEADIAQAGARPGAARVRFWLEECRTPERLDALARRYPRAGTSAARKRPAVAAILRGDAARAARELLREQERERERDRRYWRPLRRELEALRLSRPRP